VVQSGGSWRGAHTTPRVVKDILKALMKGFHFVCLFSPWPFIYPVTTFDWLCMSKEDRIIFLCRKTFISNKEVSQTKLRLANGQKLVKKKIPQLASTLSHCMFVERSWLKILSKKGYKNFYGFV
jgi:hypothetical protein